MNREKIIASGKLHLEKLIQKEINKYGNKCSLNHIDVSNLNDMSMLFHCSEFNGDISEWDVSNVKDMSLMFANSKFTGDISKWNISNVTIANAMFLRSLFDNNIANWNVSNIKNIARMFYESNFSQDLTSWRLLSLTNSLDCFHDSKVKKIPYWANFNQNELTNGAIQTYLNSLELYNNLNSSLSINVNNNTKLKI